MQSPNRMDGTAAIYTPAGDDRDSRSRIDATYPLWSCLESSQGALNLSWLEHSTERMAPCAGDPAMGGCPSPRHPCVGSAVPSQISRMH